MGDLPRACLSGAEGDGAGAVTGGLGSWAGRVKAMGSLESRCVCVSCLCQLYSVLYCHLCIVDGSLSPLFRLWTLLSINQPPCIVSIHLLTFITTPSCCITQTRPHLELSFHTFGPFSNLPTGNQLQIPSHLDEPISTQTMHLDIRSTLIQGTCRFSHQLSHEYPQPTQARNPGRTSNGALHAATHPTLESLTP